MANNFNFNGAPSSSQFQFPQPQGSFYVLNNSMEISNVPAGQAMTAALCPSENLLYLKCIQNGQPSLLVFQTVPYNPPKPGEVSQEVLEALKKLNERIDKLEKKKESSLNDLI